MKDKKFWAKLIFVCALIAAIVYTFRDSADDIAHQIAITAPWVLAVIGLMSVIYHLFEALITWRLAKKYQPEFRYFQAFGCAWYCSFYRVSTLGSGAGVAAVYYLSKRGVPFENATGLYLVQYVFHKISIAIFSGLFFVLNYHFMLEHFRGYLIYMVLAYGLTVLIAVGLLLIACTSVLNKPLFALTGALKKISKIETYIITVEEKCSQMQKSTAGMIHSKKFVPSIIIANIVKLAFWYCIPFFICLGMGSLSILDSWSVTSLSVMTAAVIPTPAGIGSVEYIMTTFFSEIVGVELAGATTILYRVATFVLPCLIGGVMIVIMRARNSKKKHSN